MKTEAVKSLQRFAASWGALPQRRKGIMLPTRSSPREQRGYLSAVVIAKDEGPYLKEWLEFHRIVGFGHVYFYDNGSTDETADVLGPYVEAGYVSCIPWIEFDLNQRTQFQAYAHALCNFGSAWRWMAFFDIDEFLFPLKDESLPSVLNAYEDLPAIAVPWHMFGFSGHEHRPDGLVIENFTMRAPFPAHHFKAGKTLSKWKSIVDPRRVVGVRGAHLFMLDENDTGAFDENRRRINGDELYDTLSSEILRLNHYFTKSKEELEIKICRGCVHGKLDFRKRVTELANAIEVKVVADTEIYRYLPRLRRAMQASS